MKIVLLSLFTLITFNLESNAQEVQTNENGEPPFEPNNPYVHDPVMAKDGDTYYVFVDRSALSLLSPGNHTNVSIDCNRSHSRVISKFREVIVIKWIRQGRHRYDNSNLSDSM